MKAVLAAVALALAVATAHAQEPEPDPIGDLLQPLRPPPTAPRPAAPTLSRPVFVHETGRSPDAPPSASDVAYDNRLKSSAASAQGLQGPMNGAWTLSAGGRDRYALQLIDRNGVLEGAWRDLRQPASLHGSGVIEAVERTGDGFTLRITPSVTAALRPSGGRWTGELTEPGRRETATLTRRSP
jgi:hypothetical protein